MATGGQVPGPRTESIQDSCLLSHMLLTEKRAELPNWRRVNDSNTGPPSPHEVRAGHLQFQANWSSIPTFHTNIFIFYVTCEMEEKLRKH